MFKRLEVFRFQCSREIQFQGNQQVVDFMNSMKHFMENLRVFEFLHGSTNQQGYSIVMPSNFSSELSKLLSYSQMIKVCRLNFSYIGWNYNRSIYIPSSFLSGLLQYSDSWPSTFQAFEINLDRMIYMNTNMTLPLVLLFLQKLSKILQRQSDLKEFSLNLSGFKPEGTYSSLHKFFQPIINAIPNVTNLNLELGGSIKMSQIEWQQFLSAIKDLNRLEKLNLNIEFWKDFLQNPLNSSCHCQIIERFIEDLLSKHKKSLIEFLFNTDGWSFLNVVDHDLLIKKISQFENLKKVQLLFWKSQVDYRNEKIRKFQIDVSLKKTQNSDDLLQKNKVDTNFNMSQQFSNPNLFKSNTFSTNQSNGDKMFDLFKQQVLNEKPIQNQINEKDSDEKQPKEKKERKPREKKQNKQNSNDIQSTSTEQIVQVVKKEDKILEDLLKKYGV